MNNKLSEIFCQLKIQVSPSDHLVSEEILINKVVNNLLSQIKDLPELKMLVKEEILPHEVLIIGSGTGTKAVCQALVSQGIKPLAISGIVDTGGTSGKIRQALKSPTLGDHRNILLALSPESNLKSYLDSTLEEKDGGPLKGIRLADFFIAALGKYFGDFGKALIATARLLQSQVIVLPSADAYTDIVAQTEAGERFVGEAEIILRGIKTPPEEELSPISKLWLQPQVRAYPESLSQIKSAKFLIIPPGDFHAGLLAALLPEGLIEAINKALKSGAKLIQIINGCNRRGQTENWTVNKYLASFSQFTSLEPDFVLANTNTKELEEKNIDYPKIEKPLPQIVPYDLKPTIIVKKLANQALVYYDNKALGEALKTLI